MYFPFFLALLKLTLRIRRDDFLGNLGVDFGFGEDATMGLPMELKVEFDMSSTLSWWMEADELDETDVDRVLFIIALEPNDEWLSSGCKGVS